MRIRLALTAVFAAALAVQPPSLDAQGTPADSVHWRATKLDLDSIARDKTAPLYSKRAQTRIRVRDSLRLIGPVVPPPVVTPPNPPPVPDVRIATITIHGTGASLAVGSTMQLSTEVKSTTGTTITPGITWSATPTAVGTISASGLLSANAPGTVAVSAKADTATGLRTFTVTGTAGSDSTPTQPPTTPPPTSPPPTQPPPTGVIFTHPYAPLSSGAAFAELPRDSVSIAVPAPTRTIVVKSLQAAYDTAQTGDLLRIPANTTIDQPAFGLTPRQSWVTIAGTDATSVIRNTTGGATSAINILPGAHHIQFLGPLTVTTATTGSNALYRSYNGETDPAKVPHHIIANGITIDPTTKYEVRRCAWPDGAYMAIVNSTMRNCSSKSGDAQGIEIGNGPGPYRFENNYIEAGHQCFMSGGFDPSIPNGVPSDVVFRWNTCFKPLWYHYAGTSAAKSYPDSTRQVKTIIEAKFIRRALIERNLLINVWADAQAGFCFLWKSENQGGYPNAQTVDVTVRYNRCRNISSGINIAAHPNPGIALTRLSAYDNVFENLSTVGGEGICFQILDDVRDVILLHNTCSNATNNAISFSGAPGVRTSVVGNVIANGAYGVKGDQTGIGTLTIAKWVTLFEDNVIVGADCSQYPAGTRCALSSPAPLAADGKPIGADTSKVVP